MSSDKVYIVNVVNNFDFYHQVLQLSKGYNPHRVVVYDNTQENIGIPKRYNSFIKDNVKKDSDFWIIFAHQDFGFFSDPYEVLKDLDKQFLYGVVAPDNKFSFVKYFKSCFINNLDYYPSIKINIKNLINFKRGKFIEIRKKPRNCRHLTDGLWGEISQGRNNFDFYKSGIPISKPKVVNTIDCCCIIMHSSLINKYNIRFDENLNWHMYAEELCINCRKNFKVDTKVAQFDCFHTSTGNLDKLPNDFYESADYVKHKHHVRYVNSTCID